MFYDTEILIRKQLKYPPFCDIIVIGFNGLNEKELIDIGNKTYSYLKEHLGNGEENKEFKIFKPMPAPIDKIQNRYRYRIIIKGVMNKKANDVLNNYLKKVYQKDLKDIRISIDVNPNNMAQLFLGRAQKTALEINKMIKNKR